MTFTWEPEARADLRRLDQHTAMRVLLALSRYGQTGEGDVKRLKDRQGLLRLRVGKWRVFLMLEGEETARVYGIDNRGEAY
ncbi:MAG: type II toxin-antitoxin system RelE/ParE family toxin [Bryobacteraceae bacterium]|nr:type II toxin-antitoxin system RelE/ParE family toxin [Bryobacteraceae bacterium]